MSLKLQPTSVIKANLGLTPNGKVQKYFTNLCYRYMDKYVPYDEGNLRKNVEIYPNKIVYESPYAHYIYTGILYVDPVTGSSWARKGTKKISTETSLKYHTPNTFPYWDKKMWSIEKDDVIKKVQKFVNRGGK